VDWIIRLFTRLRLSGMWLEYCRVLLRWVRNHKQVNLLNVETDLVETVTIRLLVGIWEVRLYSDPAWLIQTYSDWNPGSLAYYLFSLRGNHGLICTFWLGTTGSWEGGVAIFYGARHACRNQAGKHNHAKFLNLGMPQFNELLLSNLMLVLFWGTGTMSYVWSSWVECLKW